MVGKSTKKSAYKLIVCSFLPRFAIGNPTGQVLGRQELEIICKVRSCAIYVSLFASRFVSCVEPSEDEL